MFKIGDKVNVKDRSYGFGIQGGEYTSLIPMENLTVIKIDLQTTRNIFGKTSGAFSELCDLLVADNDGFYFIPSQDCKPVDKEIEIRYFSDGKDVTDQISDETKRNLKAL